MDRFSQGIDLWTDPGDIAEDLCASYWWSLPGDRSLNWPGGMLLKIYERVNPPSVDRIWSMKSCQNSVIHFHFRLRDLLGTAAYLIQAFFFWSLWYLHPLFFVFSGLSKTGRGSRLEVLFDGVFVQFWSSATECSGKDCFSYDWVTREQVSHLLDCHNAFLVGLFDLWLKLFVCLALHESSARNNQPDKYARLLEMQVLVRLFKELYFHVFLVDR